MKRLNRTVLITRKILCSELTSHIHIGYSHYRSDSVAAFEKIWVWQDTGQLIHIATARAVAKIREAEQREKT